MKAVTVTMYKTITEFGQIQQIHAERCDNQQHQEELQLNGNNIILAMKPVHSIMSNNSQAN
jgi:hypothetical protein